MNNKATTKKRRWRLNHKARGVHSVAFLMATMTWAFFMLPDSFDMTPRHRFLAMLWQVALLELNFALMFSIVLARYPRLANKIWPPK